MNENEHEDDGVKYVAVEGGHLSDCDECAFECGDKNCVRVKCSRLHRADGQEVYFVKAES